MAEFDLFDPLKPKTFMLIAGEASGDQLAAELVASLRARLPEAKFFGAGGTKMTGAGVDVAVDLTKHAVTGISDVLKKILEIWRVKRQLLALAIERRPDVIIGVDYGEFNARFTHAVKQHVRKHPSGWSPKIVKFISPQVWASRPGRAYQLAADNDLLLSIFPFEKEWYAKRVPQLRVEFVGHPMVGRFTSDDLRFTSGSAGEVSALKGEPKILLLPGSRRGELKHHLTAMVGALKIIQAAIPSAKAKMILPSESLVQLAKSLGANLDIQIGNLPQALTETSLAITKTGTVTMECAFFGVPAVTCYKGSWLDYQIAKRLVTVTTFTMPNLLAGKTVYPEFLQYDLTAENLAKAALDLLQNESRRAEMKAELGRVVASLGEPGAAGRAAEAILSLFP
jgi:lipid-A-disaccharide synthase